LYGAAQGFVLGEGRGLELRDESGGLLSRRADVCQTGERARVLYISARAGFKTFSRDEVVDCSMM